MAYDFKESDWKRFSAHLVPWRERYLEKRNKELIALLSQEGKTPTEQFWNAHERIEKEAKILKNCLDGYSRLKMWRYMAQMYYDEMIFREDLEGFSKELRDSILRYADDA